MPAPKGNKNALRGIAPKTSGYRLKITPDNLRILKTIAAREKISMAQVIEKALLSAYPKDFSGKF